MRVNAWLRWYRCLQAHHNRSSRMAAEPPKSPSMTLNSARTKPAPGTATTKKPRRTKEKVEDKKKTETDEAAEKTEIEKGSAVFIFPTGMRYEGEWQKFDGVVKRHGLGVLAAVHPVVEAEGDQVSTNEGTGGGGGTIGEMVEWIYEGEWKEDTMHGRGVFRFPSGAVFDGEWENNKYMGAGRYTFPDGSQYEGAFYDNKIHGQGLFVDVKNEVWKGRFYNNTGPGLVVSYNN